MADWNFHSLLERDLLPDWMIRLGIRQLLRARLRELEAGGPSAQQERMDRFFDQLRAGPIALQTEAANAQHYEVPAAFYELVLGRHLKYSCGLWEAPDTTLDESEAAMLALTCERARLEDGQDILELGCGWGSLSLYMAERFPRSRILAVSNSASQRRFLERRAEERGLRNVEVETADMNEFDVHRRFDRAVSVEMFEHMRNQGALLRRIAGWLRDDGLLFVHIFAHQRFAYPFEVRGSSDWMAQHFFAGGMMPSANLLRRFSDSMTVCQEWEISGLDYWRTCEAWLERLDGRRQEALALFAQDGGAGTALRNLVRWRVFFLACGELFRYRQGREWSVRHYLLEKRSGANNKPPQ
ncbi:MAG TPA: cyclopropane-fatty-acyl-phospholipid synthase family protein [Bryobacteraceae bacterium]|nr:cyclopropane-fatty-acyl-phospholipid synthase family protein [Bryobacteraceae bacterium]